MRRPVPGMPLPIPCIADHSTLISGRSQTAKGLQWARCRVCGVPVESAYATGKPAGPEDGPGRGELSPSLMRWLAKL